MAANGERASRREHVIAVVAIVVTGLVSAAGVVVSCQSSRDSQRTAREAQRETARAQREQADLAELRSVLDRAAAALEELRVATYQASRQPVPSKRISSAQRATRISGVRLLIRLGARADAVQFFDDATYNYALASP